MAVLSDHFFDPPRHRLICQLCTEEQLHRPTFRRWAKAMQEKVNPQRKQWEWCDIAEALDQRGKLRPGMRGLGFAVGREPHTALFAARGCHIVATDLGADATHVGDWTTTGQHASDIAHLYTRGLKMDLGGFVTTSMGLIAVKA